MTNEQILEFRKCGSNFSYFCENYVKVTNPGDKGLVPFKLYPFQERVSVDFQKNRFNIVRKFRQAGLTTLASIFGLWKCIFDLDQRILLLSKTDREALKVGQDIEQVIRNLPKWLKPDLDTDTAHEKRFASTNGLFWFYSPEAARSRSASFLIVDEAAFIKKMSDHWSAMYPILSGGGACAVISTVNGMRGDGEWYYETFTKAEQHKNKFNAINLNFKEHPDYAKPEFEATMRPNMGEKKWAQEFLGAFLGSADTYIAPADLAKIHADCKPPIRKILPEWDTSPPVPDDEKTDSLTYNSEYEKGALWEWEFPQEGTEYIIAADNSYGLGEDCDATAIQIINLSTFEQVAEFQSNIIGLFDFAQIVANIGEWYNQALIVVENNGPGIALIKHLTEKIRYPNMYHSSQVNGKREVAGLTMSALTRPAALENMRICLSRRLVKINSVRLHDELQSFIINKAKQRPEAARGKHDDLILSLVCGLYIIDNMNQTVPVGAADLASVRDIVGDAILGSGFDAIRKALEDGVENEDLDWLNEFDENDLMPNKSNPGSQTMGIQFMNNKFKRPNEDLLKSFGW